jgi:hypothetical protein
MTPLQQGVISGEGKKLSAELDRNFDQLLNKNGSQRLVKARDAIDGMLPSPVTKDSCEPATPPLKGLKSMELGQPMGVCVANLSLARMLSPQEVELGRTR